MRFEVKAYDPVDDDGKPVLGEFVEDMSSFKHCLRADNGHIISKSRSGRDAHFVIEAADVTHARWSSRGYVVSAVWSQGETKGK